MGSVRDSIPNTTINAGTGSRQVNVLKKGKKTNKQKRHMNNYSIRLENYL